MQSIQKKDAHHLVIELQKAQLAGLIMWYHTCPRKPASYTEEFAAFCIFKFKPETTQTTKTKIQNYILSTYKDVAIELDLNDQSTVWVQRRVPTENPL